MQLHISENIDSLSKLVAGSIVDRIKKALLTQQHFSLVLSGGSTPKKLHELLAGNDYKNKIDWSKVHIFFGDERFVPLADDRNNAKMAYDTLLNHVAVDKKNIHIMQTENCTPQESAVAYDEALRAAFPDPVSKTFDLVLLGMGDDGHTLSLFPGHTTIIHEREKWCTAFWLEPQEMFRVTLTHSIVNQAAAVFFLVSGNSKTYALEEVLYGKFDPEKYPSQVIKPVHGELHWFTDEAAAGSLSAGIK